MARFNSMLAKALLVLVSCAALAQSANAVLVYNFNQYELFPIVLSRMNEYFSEEELVRCMHA